MKTAIIEKTLHFLCIVFLLLCIHYSAEAQFTCNSYTSCEPPPYPEGTACLTSVFAANPFCCNVQFDMSCQMDLANLCDDGQDCTLDNCSNSPVILSPPNTCNNKPIIFGNDGPPGDDVCLALCPTYNNPRILTMSEASGCPQSAGTLVENSPPGDNPPTTTDGCLIEVFLFDGICCTCDWDLCCNSIFFDITSANGANTVYTTCGYQNTAVGYPCNDGDPNTIDRCDPVLGCTNTPVGAGGVCASTAVRLELFLEGPYAGSLLMSTAQKSLASFPLSQPFNQDPWNYSGTEAMSATTLGREPIVDWVLVELYNPGDFSAPVAQAAGLLLEDGKVMDATTGSQGFINFAVNLSGSYQIVVRARNHLPVAAVNSVSIPNTTPYDFSNLNALMIPVINPTSSETDQAQGQQINLVGSFPPVFALYAGDVNNDGIINFEDMNSFMENNGGSSYATGSGDVRNSDLTMDGSVDTNDFNLLLKNINRIGVEEIRIDNVTQP